MRDRYLVHDKKHYGQVMEQLQLEIGTEIPRVRHTESFILKDVLSKSLILL